MGWSDHEAMNVPITRIILGVKYKVEFLQKTNPFGSGEPKEDKKKVSERNPKKATKDLKRFLEGRIKLQKARKARGPTNSSSGI